MHKIEHSFELNEFLGIFDASICIEVECVKSEPEVRYTRNGDGYPGSPATVWPFKATIMRLGLPEGDINREGLEHCLSLSFLQRLDDLALDAAHDAVGSGNGWLAEEMFQALADAAEDTRR